MTNNKARPETAKHPLLFDACRAAIIACRKVTKSCGSCTDTCTDVCKEKDSCLAVAQDAMEPLAHVKQECRKLIQEEIYEENSDEGRAVSDALRHADEFINRYSVAEVAPAGEKGHELCKVLFTMASEAISVFDTCIERLSPPGKTLVEQYKELERPFLHEKKRAAAAGKHAGDKHDHAFSFWPYLPLLAVLASGLVFATVMCWYRGPASNHTWLFMHDAMGFVLMVLGLLKVVNLQGFARVFRGYDILAQYIPAYAYVYPFIEAFLGLSFLKHWWPHVTYGVTAAIMLIGAVGIALKLRAADHKDAGSCGCLGMVFDVPLSMVSLLENLLMAAGALSMYFM